MRIFLFVALLCQMSTAQAQSLVSGKVTNKKNGQPLEGVTVQLTGRNVFGTHTNENGYFAIKVTNGNAYTLQVSYLGFKAYSQQITVNGATNVNISLEETGLFVKPVEIASLRATRTAPFTKSELSAEDIKKQNLGQDLPLLLNQMPGVVTNSDAGNGVGYTGIRVRGTDITRINVTANGIPLNDAESQGVFFVNMPDFASSLSSIQLQRGVGTSTNGGSAFGATMNLSTNTFNDKAYAEFDNSYGSYDTWKHTVKAGTGLINDHFTFDARLSKISSNGYVDRASSDLKSFYTSAAYISKNTAIRLNIFSGKEKTYQAWNGITKDMLETNRRYNSSGTEKPGEPYDNETDNYQQTHYQLFLNQVINDHLNFNVALHMTRGKGYYENYKAGEEYASYGLTPPVIGDTTITATDLVRQLWLDNYFYGTVFSLNGTHNRFNWSVGGGYNRYDGNHYGKVIWAEYPMPINYKWYDLDAFKSDLNFYAKGEYAVIEKLKAFADVQYRHVKYDIDGFRKNPTLVQNNKYNFFNPKVGLNYAINDQNSAYASFAVANKEPNRDDFEAGVTNTPKPEKLQNVEAGYAFRSKTVVLQANVYYMDYKDQLVLTGRINDVGAYTRVNIPKSYRAGIELQAAANVTNYFTVAANAAFSKNKIKHLTAYIDDAYYSYNTVAVNFDNTDISFSPNVVAGYTLTFKPVKNLNIDILGKYVGAQFLDNTSNKDAQLPSYFVSDARINYLVPQKLFKELGLTLMLNNIFNKKYVANGYTYTYFNDDKRISAENGYYPMAEFNVMAGVHVAF
ncbi:iron complex outermembrane receptor protein [Chitinophaga skermanii]|uniref:Iron complex outermembrane receptor protein n=1 Tax=Chitinophaga skermanii TaxID=331697 RepID=A0A327Q7X4_9BACT|nr:TonB-dependent receptor [Chitinophaga skermanii]RAI99352.1 iron complex outermembrane receptor protein [Chitinophaga skermanii]